MTGDNYSPLLDQLLADNPIDPTPPPPPTGIEPEPEPRSDPPEPVVATGLVETNVPATDRTTVRMVVAFLGVICLAALGAAVWLASQDIDPAVISAVAVAPLTTALGALAAVLVSTRSAP